MFISKVRTDLGSAGVAVGVGVGVGLLLGTLALDSKKAIHLSVPSISELYNDTTLANICSSKFIINPVDCASNDTFACFKFNSFYVYYV